MRYATGLVLAAALAFATDATRVELQAHSSFSSAEETSSTGISVASRNQHVPPDAPARAYGMDVPLAYYNLSFTLSKRTGGITPPVQARIFAYMGLALYESVVSGTPHNRSIASSLHGIGPLPSNDGTKYWPLVASAALAEVMRGLWGDATNVAAQNIADIGSLEQQIANSFDLQGSLARRSIDFGHAVGAAIYETSLDDGEDRSYLTNFPTDYVPPVCDGCWVPTTPVPMAMQPYWKDRMTPFVLTPGDCGMDGPSVFSTDPNSEAYQEAYQVYVTRNNLTPDQITIARFWADGGGSINGPGHSLSTASQILQLVGANLAEAAETYARVGLAVGDGVYAVWWSKYTYNWLRPITYIKNYIDPTWTTLLPTPPFPEYTSAHSGQTSAAINTLIALWGDIAYTDHTHDADGFAPRMFASLTDSMNETAVSRLYAGIHFHSAIYEGIDQGRCVATEVNALPWRK
jgi:PAP2 superfamily